MIRIGFTGLLVLGLSLGFAREDASQYDMTNDRPVIKFEKTTHDFGRIAYKGDGTYHFKFKNKGEKPLVLTAVWASCGCTTPSWPKKPIESGKTDTIKVVYDTRIKGNFSKSVRVHSNAKNSPVYLRIKGTVLPQDQKISNKR